MKEFIERVNNHRTIREFTDEKISEEFLDILFDSLMRTATSNGLQQASIIRVTDQDKKDAIAKICQQDYVARAPVLLIFVADCYRNIKIAEAHGGDITRESDVDIFFQGFTDAILLAQNATNIVESAGLGAVFLGSILNDAKGIIEILNLPEMTLPAVGMGFGHPAQEPQLKPRMDKKFRVFENEYKILDDYKEELKDYDQEMTTYYDLRDANRRVDSFSNQVIKKLSKPVDQRLRLLEFARENGFRL